MANRTCIGTTDTPVEDPVTQVTDDDRDFVLSNINARLDLSPPLTRKDIIAERCGVRPLAIRKTIDASADLRQVSRKHVIEMDADNRHISIFGGKLTDCINVGDEISDCVSRLGLKVSRPAGKWYTWSRPTGSPGHRRGSERASVATIRGKCQYNARSD
jgi:glycerol-3-phosphate dehydrogenase